jgi:hypothetical protein
VELEHVLVTDHCNGFEAFAEPAPELCEQSSPDIDLERSEQGVLSALDESRRHLFVQRLPLVEQTPELLPVLRKRTTGVADALPCSGYVDVHPEGERARRQQLACAPGKNGPAPQGDHGERRRAENLSRDLFLEAAKRGLAPLEELGDGTVAPLDLTIEVDERPAAEAGNLLADRRLPRAHEADEGEMSLERPYRGDQSIRSRYVR